jgi:predicted ATP-grasp superfamily ATP-dependent carboligase
VTSELSALDTSTPAVVLKFDPNVMHHGGLGVIRSLGRIGVPVYGVHEGPWAPAANSRYLQGRCFWQPRPEDVDRVRAGLLRLADRVGRPAVLIPTDDAGAIFLAEHGDDLRPWFLFPDPPRDLPRRLAGKYSLYQLCRELGVPCAQTILPESLDAARGFAAGTGFPLIAKLTTPWRHGSEKLRSTSIVTDAAQLDRSYLACAQAGVGLMLQEFIPGGNGPDWFFHGYCDANSACQPAFTGVKERSYPAHAGLTSLGRATDNTRLRDEVTSLLRRLGYRGILDLDLRWDARDGQYKLLDFNPRLGAQFRLFRDTAGIDVVTASYLDLTGQPGPAAEQVSGRGFLVENYDPIGAFSYWRGGELGLKSWLTSLRTVDETAWFARDDLRPFGLMCLRMGWRLATRPLAGRGRAGADGAGRRTAGGDRLLRYAPGRAATGIRRAPPGQQPITQHLSKRQPMPRSHQEGTRV